jgi:hypothetical protein
MSELLYKVGDRVLASRGQDGENHEEATVVDAYSLLIGEEVRPMVRVEFEDGELVFLTATEPDVRPIVTEEDEEDEEDGEAAEPGNGDPDADG